MPLYNLSKASIETHGFGYSLYRNAGFGMKQLHKPDFHCYLSKIWQITLFLRQLMSKSVHI